MCIAPDVFADSLSPFAIWDAVHEPGGLDPHTKGLPKLTACHRCTQRRHHPEKANRATHFFSKKKKMDAKCDCVAAVFSVNYGQHLTGRRVEGQDFL